MGKPRNRITSLRYLQWLKIKDLIPFNLLTKVFRQKIKDYPNHILSLPTVNYMTDSTTRRQNNARTTTDTGEGPFMYEVLNY